MRYGQHNYMQHGIRKCDLVTNFLRAASRKAIEYGDTQSEC
jgi:hypothetical protein